MKTAGKEEGSRGAPTAAGDLRQACTPCQRGTAGGPLAAPLQPRLPGRRARPAGGAGAEAPPTSGCVTMGRAAERGCGGCGSRGGGAAAATAAARVGI